MSLRFAKMKLFLSHINCVFPANQPIPARVSSHWVTSTAQELLRATVIRLLPRYARITATISAEAPEITLPVLVRIPGKVMAVRHA